MLPSMSITTVSEKKILASGNGRCNIINTTATHEDYAGNEPHFVTYALKQLSFHYFEKILPLHRTRIGYKRGRALLPPL